MTTAFISHPDCLLHDTGKHHPESPERIAAVEEALSELNLDDSLIKHEAPIAPEEHLLRVHGRKYLDFLNSRFPEKGHLHVDRDTVMSPGTKNAALRAAGAVIKAVDLVINGDAVNAFCNVRPPGHHAESNRAMGFCFYNNIAVGAAYALTHNEIDRVAILDFDVHHGNGTEEIFAGNENVLMCSVFQYPSFPGGDYSSGQNHIVNITLEPGSSPDEFRKALKKNWFPKIKQFKPDMIFLSAGFDAHWKDPLAELRLSESDYEWLTKEVLKLAHKFSQSRVISALEGGYDMFGLGKSAAQHIQALIDN